MTTNSKKSIIQVLWERKVPQYLGTYFAVGFGLLQFVEFITRRYNLSGSLVDKYLLIWLALVPAIVIITYFGGQLKFKSTSLKWPKVFVIINVLLAFSLGGILFNESAIGQTAIIEVVDENGKTLTAVVPGLNKIKTIANFQFENLTDDRDNDWIGVAFSQLLQLNLNQQPEFYAYSAYSLNTFHDGMGLPSFVTPNVGMQREIARKSRNDYFTDISYTIKNEQYEFKGNLYSAKDGKSISELYAIDDDPYSAIDKLKQQIFDIIPDAFKIDGKQMNMPASSLITSNIEALKLHTLSRITFYKAPTALEETLELERKAVALDPQCATCHFWIGDVLYGLGRKDEAIASVKQAIVYGKALPERMQFYAKEILYNITNNIDAYRKLQEMRRKMYPYEFEPYERLVGFYRVDYGNEGAIALLQEAIDNGNVEKGLLGLYELYLVDEEYEQALNILDRLSKEFPDRDEDRLKYASIYEKQGSINKAKEVLLKEEALDPFNTNIQGRIATLDFRSQDIVSANKRLDKGLRQATTLTDSLMFLWNKSLLLENSGQVDAALKTIEDFEKFAVKRSPVNKIIIYTFTRKAFLNLAIAKPERVEKLLSNLIKYSPESEGIYNCYVNVYSIQNDYDMFMDDEEFRLSCREEYENFGRGFGSYFDVIRAYQDKDYEKGIKLLESENGKMNSLLVDQDFISKIYAKSGDVQKAKEIIKKEVDQKTEQPKYYYDLAMLLETENPKAAKEYLAIALKFWSNADPNYIPFQRAISLSQRLGQNEQSVKL